MSARACPRLWEAEAVRDGRLSGALADDFQRHAASCALCARECAQLEALARELRQGTHATDEVALRRARHVTLKRAAASLVHDERERAPLRSRGWMFAAGVLACALGFAALRLYRELAPRSPLIVMQPSEGAKFRRHHERGLEAIDLDEGSLRLSVRRKPDDPRVVVRVPDGEVEDFGTVFEVMVRGRKTLEIAVNEGVVVYHRRGQSDLRLSAGMVWAPAARDLAPQKAIAPAAPVAPVFAAPRKPPHTQSARLATQHPPPAAVTNAPSVQTAPSVIPPAPAFDANGEDSAYLRVLALLTEGRREEARLAAAEYLGKYPAGFRRLEIERIAHPGAR